MHMNDTIPAGMQTKHLPETESDTMPEIVREGNTLFIPMFVREVQREEATSFRFFRVPVRYTGQDTSDFDKCVRQSYKEVREFFYGSAEAQADMEFDHLKTAHILAVKNAVRKPGQSTPPEGIARWNDIKEDFWDLVDEACAAVHKTRADLPSYFNSKQMMDFAKANGMSDADIITYTVRFVLANVNAESNGRNWSEFFVND